MLQTLSRDEYLESIAFGTLHLLEKWTEEGTLGERDLVEVINDQNDLALTDRVVYRVLDVLWNEVYNQGYPLETKRRKSKTEKRRLSHLRAILGYVDPVWNESRIKALDGKRAAETIQVM